MSFLADTFTDADDTLLSAHVADSGATWTRHPTSGSNVLRISSNRVRNGNGGGAVNVYTASVAPATADYDVTAVLRVLSDLDETVGVIGRADTVATTFYLARYTNSGTPGWRLASYVGGTLTNLGTQHNQTLTIDQDYTVTLRLRGTSLELYVDGVLRCSATDSALTVSGRAGVRFFTNGAAPTAASGTHLDTLSALEPDALVALVACSSDVSATLTRLPGVPSVFGPESRLNEFTFNEALLNARASSPLAGSLTTQADAVSTVTAHLTRTTGVAAVIDPFSALAVAELGRKNALASVIGAAASLAVLFTVKRGGTGTVAGVSGVSALLGSIAGGFAAAPASSSTVTAGMQRKRGLSATVGASSSLSADLAGTGRRDIAAIVSAHSALGRDLLYGEVEYNDWPEGANMVRGRGLAAPIAAVATATGTINRKAALVALVVAQSTTTAAVVRTQSLSAICAATSTASAAVSRRRPASSTVSAASAIIRAELDTVGLHLLHANVHESAASLSVVLGRTASLSATVAAQSSTAGALETTGSLAATVAASSTLAPTIVRRRALAAVSAAQGATTAHLARTTRVAAIVDALSAQSATVALTRLLAAFVAEASAASATLGGEVTLSATIEASSSIAAGGREVHDLSASIAAQSDVAILFTTIRQPTASIVAVSEVAASGLETVRGLSASIVAVSRVSLGHRVSTITLVGDRELTVTLLGDRHLAVGLIGDREADVFLLAEAA